MEARSSYHDLKGSVEADVSYRLTKRPLDPELTEAVKSLGLKVDTKRYKIAGFHLYATGYAAREKGKLNVTFVVQDVESGEIKKIRQEIVPNQFFQLFEHLDLYLFHGWFKSDTITHIDNIPEVE